MTIASTTSRVVYGTNGTTGPFAVPFYFLANAHIQAVYKTSAGVETTLVLDTDYTVTGADDPAGGTVTTTTAYPAGGSLTIIRSVPATQETDYSDQDAFSAESHEDALDKLTMIAQQVSERMDRALVLSPGTTTSGALPSVADRKNKYLGFDSGGNVTATAPSPGTALELAADLLAAGAADGAAMVGFLQAGAGAVARSLQIKVRDWISVKDFGALGDGVTDDTAAIQAGIDALVAGQSLVFPAAIYVINGALTVTTDDTGMHFDNCVFLVGDTGADGTTTNASTGKMGFLFKEADHLRLTGAARLIGQGTVGTTTLAGMVFDTCDFANVQATFYYENMAAGRFVMWCDYGRFGDVLAYRMKGTQTFSGVGTAGTAEVVLGCLRSQFGRISSLENYKPVRYLSVALDGASATIDNQECSFGWVTGTPAVGSIECSLLAVRSAVNCYFDGCAGAGFSMGLYFVLYTGDTWSIDGNTVGAVAGTYATTGASVDAAVVQDMDAGLTMGHNHINQVHASCAGEFGIYVGCGELSIADAVITGSATRPVVGLNCTVSFGRLVTSGAGQESVAIGKSCNFNADLIDVRTGSTGAASGAVAYATAYGAGSVGEICINTIKYRQNAIGTDYVYAYMDLVNGAEAARITNIDGEGSTSAARFGSDNFNIKRGRLLSSGEPTTGTYTRGTLIWDDSPTSAQAPGWVCTTGGTPGTWKAMASLA